MLIFIGSLEPSCHVVGCPSHMEKPHWGEQSHPVHSPQLTPPGQQPSPTASYSERDTWEVLALRSLQISRRRSQHHPEC